MNVKQKNDKYWYINSGHNIYGPFSKEKILALVYEGKVMTHYLCKNILDNSVTSVSSLLKS